MITLYFLLSKNLQTFRERKNYHLYKTLVSVRAQQPLPPGDFLLPLIFTGQGHNRYVSWKPPETSVEKPDLLSVIQICLAMLGYLGMF